MKKPKVLVCVPYGADQVDIFKERFDVLYAPTPEELQKAIAWKPDLIDAVITTGSYGFSKTHMEALPNLKMIAIRGAGVDGVDLVAARERGVAVSNCPGVNYFSVAEHAVALLLSIVRRIPLDNAGVRQGEWHRQKTAPLRPLIYKKRLGILGLGAIGKAIADRVQGFEMTIGYHNRNKRSDVPYTYYPSVLELCKNSDVLVIAAPGGPETRKIVTAEAIDELGPNGHLVNVGRGTIVDQPALIAALRAGRLAGAALDVLDGEPEVPVEMLVASNLIITPHIAGGSPESRYAAIASVCDALEAKFAGRPIPNQIV